MWESRPSGFPSPQFSSRSSPGAARGGQFRGARRFEPAGLLEQYVEDSDRAQRRKCPPPASLGRRLVGIAGSSGGNGGKRPFRFPRFPHSVISTALPPLPRPEGRHLHRPPPKGPVRPSIQVAASQNTGRPPSAQNLSATADTPIRKIAPTSALRRIPATRDTDLEPWVAAPPATQGDWQNRTTLKGLRPLPPTPHSAPGPPSGHPGSSPAAAPGVPILGTTKLAVTRTVIPDLLSASLRNPKMYCTNRAPTRF